MKFFEEISKKLTNQDSKESDGHQNNQTLTTEQKGMEIDENSVKEKSSNKMAKLDVKTVSFAEFRQGFETQTKKNHETLTGLFPTVDPDFLFGKAVEFDGKEDEMNHFIQNVFDRDLERTFPSRADREKRLKLVEENIEELAKLDVLEIQKAGIEGLEYCPFCPFAIMMDSSNTQTEFKCQNPDCSISSCRSCKKHGHPGFACNEVSDGIAKVDIPKEERKIEWKRAVAIRSVDTSNPEDREFREVEGWFLRMRQNSQHPLPAPYTNKRIASIDFLKNPILEKRFEAKRIEFKRHNFPDDVVFAFHGTKPENIDSIAKENLTIIRRAAHGGGYYFSEYPEISFGYGSALLVFKTIPGRQYVGSEMNQHVGSNAKFHSKKVFLNYGGYQKSEGLEEYGHMLVIANNEQFLPYCLINFAEETKK